MNNILNKQLLSDLGGCWILVTAALCFGMVFNQFRDKPISLVYEGKFQRLDKAVKRLSEPERPQEETQSTLKQLPVMLSLEEFKDEVDRGDVIILDARPEIFHRLGHVPGAIALPRDDFESYYRENQTLLEKDKDQQLILYCSGGSCEDSGLVEAALRKLGYTRISTFEGGWNDWTKAGLPQEENR